MFEIFIYYLVINKYTQYIFNPKCTFKLVLKIENKCVLNVLNSEKLYSISFKFISMKLLIINS